MTTLDRTARDDSRGESSSASSRGLDAEAVTAANLLSGLATRLRAAYERGADIDGLAVASHQSPAEVRELLRSAGVLLPPDDQDPQMPPALEQLRRVRRPTPSRRLSRLHPKGDGPEGTAALAGSWPGTTPATATVVTVTTQVAGAADVADSAVSAPLGILIGASPSYTEPPGQPEQRAPRRVQAQVVRVGRGTSLVVLPSWRAAIAVSVPTELLLRETGLPSEQLPGARLTVRMNPEAMHDRELDLAEWRPEPAARRTSR
ncbi:hypothetical protein [Kitasatospora sp. MMS16-BH015]|uniref:hypothetical protein n=1 Tax=Kitasatospora sp. MMS16-BH015 TaxID=2018025 RepID=UPI000CF2BF3D|nr:hypothetical protein [Kitasatospora sp. MMS16-BH015]